MSEQDDGAEPLSKRQKRLCGEADPPPSFGGGPMYDEATARKILQEAVLISAEDNEDGDEPVIGFNPDDASLNILYYVVVDFFEGNMTPLIFFAQKGDLKMCRYLISRGASTTMEDGVTPMYVAAEEGNLDICKLLYENGAQNNIQDLDVDGWTPFHIAAISNFGLVDIRYDEIVRWLVLNGALCVDVHSEEIKGDRIYPEVLFSNRNRSRISRTCERLVEWAKEVLQTHSAVVTFLGGSLPPALDEDQTRALQCLSGHPGVRKHIGDFVGLEVTKKKHLCILRQVVDALPSFIRTD
jgi:hypothetical protein